jgi:hypothetical protein
MAQLSSRAVGRSTSSSFAISSQHRDGATVRCALTSGFKVSAIFSSSSYMIRLPYDR